MEANIVTILKKKFFFKIIKTYFAVGNKSLIFKSSDLLSNVMRGTLALAANLMCDEGLQG